VLQPRVTPSLPRVARARCFTHILQRQRDRSYSSAVSDVYQDMFGEGSYAGKGIYDLDAFESALSGGPRLDSAEPRSVRGDFARAGFASDVELSRNSLPDTTSALSVITAGREATGQLLPWILASPAEATERRAARMSFRGSVVGRMIDNLRRTLSAPTAVVALAVGWTLPIYPALVWTSFVLATIVVPNLIR